MEHCEMVVCVEEWGLRSRSRWTYDVCMNAWVLLGAVARWRVISRVALGRGKVSTHLLQDRGNRISQSSVTSAHLLGGGYQGLVLRLKKGGVVWRRVGGEEVGGHKAATKGQAQMRIPRAGEVGVGSSREV